MDRPAIRDAAIVVENGRIVDTGGSKMLVSKHPDATAIDLGDSIVLPGLINAHAHLELSNCAAGESPTGSFVDWIMTIPKRRQGDDPAAATRTGIGQCLKFGVSCVGDISQQAEASRRELSRSPLRAVSFGEVLGLGGLRWKFDTLLAGAMELSSASPRLRIGLSPHAPYTVDLPGYEQCLRLSIDRGLPLATHLAESPDEKEFLTSHSGPFRDLWYTIGTWTDDVQTWLGSPIEMAHGIGLLMHPTLLAHVNYCTDAEMELLAHGRASVVYCPQTHAFFGHPPHRWREMLDRGINLAVGTDSCASSPDLNLVEDLRVLRRLAPDLPIEVLWELITLRAAKALQYDDEIGSLAAGKRADFVVFPARSENPLETILDSDALPTSLWIEGVQVNPPAPAAPC